MKRKNGLIACLCVIIMLPLVACGNQIPDMTKEQTAQISEYAARLLLSHSGNYHSKLVDTSVAPDEELAGQEESDMPGSTTEEMVQTEGGEQDGMGEAAAGNDLEPDVQENPEAPALSIAQVLGLSGTDAQYTGYEICDSYPNGEVSPENMFFAMNASAGSKLVVLHIAVTNTLPETVTLDTISVPAKYRVVLNGEHTQNALVTMLEDDFSALHSEINAGENLDTVIVAEISQEIASTIQTVGLEIRCGDNKTILTK